MYSSRIADSNDSDQFATMIRPHDNDYTVTERGSFKARSTLFTLGRLGAQQACENLCRISHFETTRVGIVLLTEPGPSFVWNGAEVGYDQVGVFGPGVSCSFRLQGPPNGPRYLSQRTTLMPSAVRTLEIARTG